MKFIILIFLAFISLLSFQAKAESLDNDYVLRLDSVVVENESKTIYAFDEAKNLVISQIAFSWKNSSWVKSTETAYEYNESDKLQKIVVSSFDAAGNRTKSVTREISYEANAEGSSIDSMIEEIKRQTGGEKFDPVNGGWKND